MRISFILFILLTSCVGSKKFTNVNLNNRLLTFNKVKLKIESNVSENVNLKGYIALVQDSIICFNLWGPLGYKVLGGEFSEKFKIFDYYNQKSNPDVLSELIDQSGIIFDRKCVENILLDRLDKVKEVLTELNKNVITFEQEKKGQKDYLIITNMPRNNRIELEVNCNKHIPSEILIKFYNLNLKWQIQIEIITVSNEKKC